MMAAHLPTPPLRLGYACSWWRPREPTWSYTPVSLRAGLIEAGVAVADIEAQPPLWQQAPLAGALTLAGMRPWKYASPYRALEAARVRRAAQRLRPQAVLELADIVTPTAVPTYAYQDMNVMVAVDHYAQWGPQLISTFPAKLDTLHRLADAQRHALQQLDGIFVMGSWFRDYLLREGVAPAERVHVVGGGVAPLYLHQPLRQPRPTAERRRLLFIGGEFIRKGGDWVLDAVARLNREGDRPLQLTIAGPASWPLPTPPPAWVDFRGSVPRNEVAALFRSHDLLVQPSRFEAYGIAFLEARASGLPCIGRDAFAMPELIEPGVGGAVWRGECIDQLAELIHHALIDDALHERCARAAAGFAVAHRWSAVAERIRGHIPH